MTNLFYKAAPFILWGLMLLSAGLIAAQFLFGIKTPVHHAFVCTMILIVAAVFLKYRKTVSARTGVVFALCGMALGVYEIVHLLLH